MSEPLVELRQLMSENGINAYFSPHNDFHSVRVN